MIEGDDSIKVKCECGKKYEIFFNSFILYCPCGKQIKIGSYDTSIKKDKKVKKS